MLWLQSRCVFVGIRHSDDSSNTDCLIKNSEHPFLQTILNLTLEHRIVNHLTLGCWCLYSLILRWVISKSLNQIRGQIVIIFSLCCLKLWWPQMLWVFVFCIQRSWSVLWPLGAVHGFGWMQVYLQVGMIIGDTEQHNKICGFCGGNGIHRQHMSRDCNVTSDDADNPNIKCTRKKVKETCRFITWGGWWQHQSRMEMSCGAYRLTMKVSCPQKVDLHLNQPLMIGAVLYPRII